MHGVHCMMRLIFHCAFSNSQCYQTQARYSRIISDHGTMLMLDLGVHFGKWLSYSTNDLFDKYIVCTNSLFE